MRLLSFLAGLSGIFLAGALAAQTPPPPQPGTPPPPPPLAAANTWYLDLSTGGRVAIQLRPDVAPAHVERIRTLTRRRFYDGLVFHRVIDGFMAQGGDPTGTGNSGSDLPDLPAEIRGLPHVRGAVAMARAQELNSANSQFYIMFAPRLSMDRNYTVFGRVVSGMNLVDAIERGEPPADPTRIVRASMASDNVPMLSAEALRASPARPVQAQAAPTLPAAAAITPSPREASAPAEAPQAALPSRSLESAQPAPVPAPPAPEPSPETTPPQPVVQDGTAPPLPPAEATTPPPPLPQPAAPTPAPDGQEEDEAAPPPPTEPSPPSQ
jgi:cyclophilin family peptidyl-prolyl cis-trans isomerase